MLGRRGVAATVRVGVRTDGGFAAHAWVECHGVPITERRDITDRYTPIAAG
jgi:hypothetical protein